MYELHLPAPVLNAAYLDVGMVGPAVQCATEDGTCDEMTRVFKGYKQRLSIDEVKRYKVRRDDSEISAGRYRPPRAHSSS
jgi:hypothetical protein